MGGTHGIHMRVYVRCINPFLVVPVVVVGIALGDGNIVTSKILGAPTTSNSTTPAVFVNGTQQGGPSSSDAGDGQDATGFVDHDQVFVLVDHVQVVYRHGRRVGLGGMLSAPNPTGRLPRLVDGVVSVADVVATDSHGRRHLGIVAILDNDGVGRRMAIRPMRHLLARPGVCGGRVLVVAVVVGKM